MLLLYIYLFVNGLKKLNFIFLAIALKPHNNIIVSPPFA